MRARFRLADKVDRLKDAGQLLTHYKKHGSAAHRLPEVLRRRMRRTQLLR